jgi:tRNA(Ile)-lysidine synthase
VTLPERFERHLAALGLPPGPALVAVSGGADSLALVALLARSPAAAGWRLEVAHVDHGIQPGSREVAERVRAAAARYGLRFHLRSLDLGPHASETTARLRRYEALAHIAAEAGTRLLLTAHHRDDQVETVLMRVLKGSGPAGLAGIASRRGTLVRPLLPFSRAELAAYAAAEGLDPWDDPANRNPRHLRSWLRTAVLPLLRERIPDLDHRLIAVARQAALDRAAWDALIFGLPALDFRSEKAGVSVAAAPLGGYDSVVLRALLAALGRRIGVVIGPARAGRIERLLAQGRSGAVAELGADSAAELSFDRLRLFRGAERPWKGVPVGVGSAGRVRVGEWVMEWSSEPAPDRLERISAETWLPAGAYLVRPSRSGDRIRPLGGPGRRLVVRCLQEARVPRSRRAAWPVVESDGIPVWVPGVCRSAECLPVPGAPALRMRAYLR